MPPFPKRAPVKPYMIDNTSTVRVWAGSLVWTAGFVAFLDYAFDVFKSVREGAKEDVGVDPAKVIKEARDKDARAFSNLQMSPFNFETVKRAKAAKEEREVTIEYKDFVADKLSKSATGAKADNPTIEWDQMKPGLHGEIVFSRSPSKDQLPAKAETNAIRSNNEPR